MASGERELTEFAFYLFRLLSLCLIVPTRDFPVVRRIPISTAKIPHAVELCRITERSTTSQHIQGTYAPCSLLGIISC